MSRMVRLVGLVVLLALGVVAPAAGATIEPAGKSGSTVLLPLSEVVLYSSGVGYFQRNGSIEGRGDAELRFKVDNVNDLLKSLVIQDFDGGQISAVTYDSRDPISKALKSFAVDLTASLGLGQLLEQLRGERIEAAAPNPIQGTILGVEKKREKVGEKEFTEVEYLNLVTADGLRSLPLAQVQRIRLANEQLNAELRQALEVLASSHDVQKKTVRLQFDGKGRRRVRVGYIVETPVWKTSYRLSLSEASRPFLQGWAIVENTSDEDWEHVKLSLISGRPISFRMELYEPLYVKRPLVVSELYESLRPQVHEQAVADLSERPAEAETAQTLMGIAPRMRAMRAMPPAMLAPRASEVDLQQGVTSTSQAMETGELFQYSISAPLSLPRRQSALLPIVNEEVRGDKLSIYNERVHAKYPMNGFRLKNSTVLHLMQGPITVFDGGIYGGDARIEDLPPGQERIISYALDLKADVAVQATPEKEEVVTASLRKGTLLVTRKYVEEKGYQVNNRDQKAKVVLIEHPLRQDWRLVKPAEPAELTRDLYRFKVTTNAGGGARLLVREEKQAQQTVRLIDSGPETIGYYVQAKQVSPKVKEALQKVIALRDRLDQTAAGRNRLEQRTKDITQEQGRIRENMAKLAQNSELYNRYVGKLNQQETDIENLRKEIESLKTVEDRQKRELNDYLLGLDLD
ncbi:hypothetical protein [Candidatus Methylomirabilis sp.]|uniref:hypothetical protein n=1 Tax=Candidatus Methylomirabilis sp. TaxID=2032687 RepID=UPI00307616A2